MLNALPTFRLFAFLFTTNRSIQSGERVFLAGQIPLIPSTLSLPTPSSFPVEASLSLKHVRSIVLALREGTGGGWDSGFVEGCICWVPRWDSDLEGARCAWDASLTKEVSRSTV
jgi:diphthine-ammonia ligase